MGIKINELVADVKKTITFKYLLNKKIAIDAFNSIYQFLAIIRQRDGTYLKDDNGNVTSHLSGLFYRTINFLEHNIKPVFVFDGKPSVLKLDTIEERRKIKEEATEKMIKAREEEDFEAAKKFAQLTSKVDENMIEESKKLLNCFGIPIIEASSEGEAQSAYLVQVGDTWACASQDYDTLLFGGERLLRNFAVSRTVKVGDTSKTLDIEYISLSKFLEHLKINREQLVEMGILIGTDFFDGIKGIGQHTALNLIRKYGSLENLIKSNVNVRGKTIDIDLEKIAQIKKIFLYPDVKKEYPKLVWEKIDYEGIQELLIEQHNFSAQRVNNALERLKKQEFSKKQITLDGFFKNP